MASSLGGFAGMAIGNSLLPGIGGVIGGMLGSMAGSMVDKMLFPAPPVEGPKLSDLSVTTSTLGLPIKILFGNNRVGGNIIWAPTKGIEQKRTTSSVGGKLGIGGTTQNTYTYFLSCALALGEGPISGLGMVWMDGNAVGRYGDAKLNFCDGMRLYTGTEDQNPDPLIAADQPNFPPCFRGIAYVVFERIYLDNFGRHVPQIEVEVYANDGTPYIVSLNAQQVCSYDNQIGSSSDLIYQQPIALSDTKFLVPTVGGVSGTHETVSATFVDFENGAANTSQAVVIDDNASSLPYQIFGSSYSQDAPQALIGSIVSHGDVFNVTARAYDKSASAFLGKFNWNTGYPYHPSVQYHFRWLSPVLAFVPVSDASKHGSGILCLDLSASGQPGPVRYITTHDAQALTPSTPDTWTMCNLQIFGDGGALILAQRAADQKIYGQWIDDNGVVANTLIDCSSLIAALNPNQQTSFPTNQNTVQVANLGGGLAILAAVGTAGSFVSVQVGPSNCTVLGTTILPTSIVGTSGSITRYLAATPTRTPYAATGNASFWIWTCLADNSYELFKLTAGGGQIVPVNGLQVAVPSFANTSQASLGAWTDNGSYLLGMNFDISNTAGTRHQLFTAVQARQTGGSADLGAIVERLMLRTGLLDSDIDVSQLRGITVDGFICPQPQAAKNDIAFLQLLEPFDVSDSVGVLKCVLRGSNTAPIVTIPTDECGFAAPGSAPDQGLYDSARTAEQNLLREVAVTFADNTNSYVQDSVHFARNLKNIQTTKQLQVPMSLNPNTAIGMAKQSLFDSWMGRSAKTFYAHPKWLVIDPGDVISICGFIVRVTRVKLDPTGLLSIESQPVLPRISGFTAPTQPQTNTQGTYKPPALTDLILLNIPSLYQDHDADGFYYAYGSTGRPWNAATLSVSRDGGATYKPVSSSTALAVVGTLTNVLPSGPALYFDDANEIDVVLDSPLDALSSASDDALLGPAYANTAVVGQELIQFGTATQIDARTWKLTHLLRARMGTEWAMVHSSGDRFVLLDQSTAQWMSSGQSDRNLPLLYKAQTYGSSANTLAISFSETGETMRPLSPVGVTGTDQPNGDLIITWFRRARHNTAWIDGIDVPLDEPVESYDLDFIAPNGSVIRTTNVAAPTFTYSASQRSADFGTNSVRVQVFQRSSRVGRGHGSDNIIT